MTELKWVLIALILLFALLLIVIFTKIKVYINYQHHNDDDHLIIQFKAWFGLIKYKLEFPLIKIDDNSPTIVVKQDKSNSKQDSPKQKSTKQYSLEDLLNSIRDVKELLKSVVLLQTIVQKFLKKVAVRKFEWHTVVGLGDAASTGMISGAIWAVKGGVVGIVSNFLKLQAVPVMSVTPQFQHAISQVAVSCMIQFRIGHAILAGIKILKYWKGGKPRFRSKPLSALNEGKTKSV